MELSTIRRAAKAGDPDAQHTLGHEYHLGVYVRRNRARAVAWYRKAAAQGHMQAQTDLGHHFRLGDGAQEDFAEAAAWYRKAAERGHAEAQCHLGSMYRDGQGVREDFAEAVAWYRKAAEQDYAHAHFCLALMYERGSGVPQDLARARELRYEADASKKRQRGEMDSLIDCGQALVRDPVVIRAFKKEYPTDWKRRVERLRRSGTLDDDELVLLEDLIQNEGRDYLRFHGKGADYDESDPSDVDLYAIDVVGLGGIYFVRACEFDDSGYFRSLDQAEREVGRRWNGVDIFGPDEINPPFEQKKAVAKRKSVKKRNVKNKRGKKKIGSRVANRKFRG